MIPFLLQKGVCLTFILLLNTPSFSQVPGDANKYLPVIKDGKWGYINQSGEMVISPRFNRAANFTDGLARVQKGENYYFIDTSGNTVLDSDLSYVKFFSEGLAAARDKSNKYGFINKQGEYVIAPQFNNAGTFSEGKASVSKFISKKAKWGYIDSTGNYIIQPKFYGAGKFVNGLAPVQIGGQDGKWGYINDKGEVIIKPQFYGARPFSEGLAAVDMHEKFGTYDWVYINTKGDITIEPEQYNFEKALPFTNGLAAVSTPFGRWWYINKKGEVVIRDFKKKRIGTARSFQGNLAFIILKSGNERFKAINQSGEQVWPKPQKVELLSIVSPKGYEAFNGTWPSANLAIAYPRGWTVTDMNKATGFIEGASFIKDKKAAQALFKNGNMEIATGQKVRLVAEGNVIINVAVQPEDVSNMKPEKFINMMGTVVNNPGEIKMRTAKIAQKPVVIRSVTGTDVDQRKVSSFQIATKRDGRLVTISAYFPGGRFEIDEQVEGIILKMLESLKVTGK